MLKSFYQEKIYEAGCDEVGRGCLAGPVIAAAVILPKNYKNNNIKDSKKISVKKRKLLEIEIKNNAIDWSIGIVNNKKIDKIKVIESKPPLGLLTISAKISLKNSEVCGGKSVSIKANTSN